MHSAIILGDVRRHLVTIDASTNWDKVCGPAPRDQIVEFDGGARIMSDAMRKYVAKTSGDAPAKLKLYTYEKPATGSCGELWQWTLAPVTIAGKSTPLTRLTRPRMLRDADRMFPELAQELRNRLAADVEQENAYFGPDRREEVQWQAPECPDIVVIDDLNGGFRQLEFEVPSVPDDVHKRLGESTETEEALKFALSLLFKRFERAKAAAEKFQNFPVMEPVIIGSIKNNPHTALGTANGPEKKNFWRRVFENAWLRARTVLLLDVDDLRDFGLSISTGLSWERTAQDTIAELRRSQEFRPILEFGQVIVRFGVTGALRIIHPSRTDWQHMLHFAPSYDDATWAVAEKDGHVLGYSSVVVASVVNSLTEDCHERGGRPLLADLPTVVGRAITESLTLCRSLSDRSYGDGCWEGFADRVSRGELLPSESSSTVDKRPSRVSVSSVPPVVMREWSILNQSVQTRVGHVAREIVRFGVKDVLNQPVLVNTPQFKEEMQHAFAEAVAESLTKCSDARMAFRSGHSRIASERFFGTRSSGFVSQIVEDLKSRLWEPTQEAIKKLADAAKAGAKGTSVPTDDVLTAIRTHAGTAFDSVIDLRKQGVVYDEPIVAPLIMYGKTSREGGPGYFYLVDRGEIEGYRAIEKLMRAHIEKAKSGGSVRPLSIAMFGPPGSGKSTAVKKINESLADPSTEILEASNLAQFTSVDDLEEAFEEIRSKSRNNRVPIAFFDEFDSRFLGSSEPLGWLKYFLAPMEEGTFRGKKGVENAILVFAGGTSTTFNEFALTDRSRADPLWVAFSQAKGPDFVSRLRGHLDIVGINSADADDELYLIRRAILIRFILSEMQQLIDGEKAKIDESMLRAVLHVPEYWHGGRSVRMLLELCRSGRDGSISPSAVPPINQLNMLVDGKAFLDLLNNVAIARSQL